MNGGFFRSLLKAEFMAEPAARRTGTQLASDSLRRRHMIRAEVPA